LVEIVIGVIGNTLVPLVETPVYAIAEIGGVYAGRALYD
jgi:hypothetical protein